jgi:D-aspartate ligase
MREHPMDPNPTRARPEWPPVVVAGAYLTGIKLMRALARRGVKTSCIDCLRQQPGFLTIYGRAYECPNPDTEPSLWLDFMRDLARKLGAKPVLIPSADQFVTAIATHAHDLQNHFTFCHSAMAVQALLATKKKQYDIAGKLGLPVPRTQFVKSLAEVRAFAATARFPCLLKPIHGREWENLPESHPLWFQKLVIVQSPAEFEAQYQVASKVNPELVLQEIIEGPDTAKFVYMSCYGLDGRRLGSCVVRELRTTPIDFGSASVVEPATEPGIDALCDGFLRTSGYAGLCEIELKRDPRDGQVKMIEANPRYSVTADAAPYAGVDLGWLHYLDLIGQPVTEVRPDGRDFRHIVLERDFNTLASYRRAGLLPWKSLFRSYRPPVAFFDFDLRDWRVTARTLKTLSHIVVRGAYRKLLGKPPRAR